MLFLPFRPPITCSMYFPAYLAKMLVLITCLITIQNKYANIYVQFSISLLSFIILAAVRPFKLWSVYLFDVVVEGVDLLIVIFNIALVHKRMSDSYNVWMMVMVFFKSMFIFFFVLLYIFFAWKNWWSARK